MIGPSLTQSKSRPPKGLPKGTLRLNAALPKLTAGLLSRQDSRTLTVRLGGGQEPLHVTAGPGVPAGQLSG